MPTVIDALVVSLGLDATGFRTGSNRTREDLRTTKENANQAAKEIEASGKKAAEFFTRLKNEALGLFAVFLGGKGLGSFVADTVASVAALGRAANAIGMDVGKLAGVGNAVEKYGGSAAAATQSYVALSDAMQRAISMGDSSKLGAFQALGVGLGDSPDQILAKLAKYSETNGVKLARLMGQQIGVDDGLITLALKGAAQARKDIEEGAKRSGISPEMTANMAALQSAWAEFSQTAEGVGRKLLNSVAPILTAIVKGLTAAVEWISKSIDKYPNFTRVVVGLVAALLTLVSALIAMSGLSLLIGGAGALLGAGGVLAGLASGLGAFTAALTSLLAPLAAIALWWEALHIRGASGPEEQAFEKKRAEEQAAANPDLVVPSVSKPDPAKEWWQRNAPAFLGGGGNAGGRNMADPAQLLAYFKSQGWTEAQAAGIIANFKGESNLDAGAVGDRGASAGLGQWRGARRDAFKAMFGHDVRYGSVMEQAQFTQWELTHTEKAAGDALRATTNRADAARVQSRRFERPGQSEADKTMNAEHRARLAMDPALFARARPPVPPQRIAQNDNSSETHIGAITINTQATDARGIARSIDPAIRNRNAMVTQANSGLS